MDTGESCFVQLNEFIVEAFNAEGDPDVIDPYEDGGRFPIDSMRIFSIHSVSILTRMHLGSSVRLLGISFSYAMVPLTGQLNSFASFATVLQRLKSVPAACSASEWFLLCALLTNSK